MDCKRQLPSIQMYPPLSEGFFFFLSMCDRVHTPPCWPFWQHMSIGAADIDFGACVRVTHPPPSYEHKSHIAWQVISIGAVPWIRNHRHFSLPCVRLNEAPIKRIIGRDGNDIEDCQPFSWFFCVLPFDIYPFGMNVLFNKLIRFIDVERERTPSRNQIVLLVRWKRADGSLMAREISRVRVPKAADTAHTHTLIHISR